MNRLYLMFILSLFVISIYAQNAYQSANSDSLNINITADSLSFNSGKNPSLAAGLSLVIPGGGQFYNKKYVKMLSVISIDAYLLQMAAYNERKRSEHRTKQLSTEIDFEQEYHKNRKNEYFKRRQSNYWWLGITTFLSMTDAYVDAHLYNFKIKKNEVELRFRDSKLELSYKF